MATLQPPGSARLSDALAPVLLGQLNAMYGKATTHMRFPGTNAVSATPRNLEKLRVVPHVLMPKTDGRHIILLLTTAVRGKPGAYMVSRRREAWRVPVSAPRSFFDGTLCEGELIETLADVVEFRCFKVLWVRGTDIRKHRFLDRHKTLVLDVSRGPCSTDKRLRLMMKEPFPVCEARRIYEENMGPRCDGLMLIPNVSDFQTGRVFNEIKWKDVHTLDFLFRISMSPSGRPRLNVLYSIGTDLVDVSRHFMFAGHHVYARHVKTDAYRAWRDAIVPSLKPESSASIVAECRTTVRPLDGSSKAEIGKREEKAMQRMRLATWMSAKANARDFGSQINIEFVKPRPDKKFPNTLTVIVSTLTESMAIDMAALEAALKPPQKPPRATEVDDGDRGEEDMGGGEPTRGDSGERGGGRRKRKRGDDR